MDFLRNRLGLKQVPRVLSWSSRADDTPVEAEYIIMDVADGIQLSRVWHQLNMHQKIMVVCKWVEFEKTVINAFNGSSSYGSLYYRKDFPTEDARDVVVNGKIDQDYVFGPSILQTLWEDRYGTPKDLKLDRGPWSDVSSYLHSISNSERAWIKRFATPPVVNGRTFFAPWEAPPHLQIPQDHLRLLDEYDSVVNYFTSDDKRLIRPTLTLRDSNQGNIFLSQETLERDGTIEISSVIDWQHTAAIPLFTTSIIPQFIDGADPAPDQPEDKFLKEQEFLRKSYHAFYKETGYDIVWASCIPFGDNYTIQQQLPAAAQYCWYGGNIKLKNLLIRTMNHWEKIVGPGIPCPLGLGPSSDEVVKQSDEDSWAWNQMEVTLNGIEKAIGVEYGGFVANDDYERAVKANEELCKTWIEGLTEEEKRGLGGVDPVELWPFKVESRVA